VIPFQLPSTASGIRKVVRSTMNREMPSIPT